MRQSRSLWRGSGSPPSSPRARQSAPTKQQRTKHSPAPAATSASEKACELGTRALPTSATPTAGSPNALHEPPIESFDSPSFIMELIGNERANEMLDQDLHIPSPVERITMGGMHGEDQTLALSRTGGDHASFAGSYQWHELSASGPLSSPATNNSWGSSLEIDASMGEMGLPNGADFLSSIGGSTGEQLGAGISLPGTGGNFGSIIASIAEDCPTSPGLSIDFPSVPPRRVLVKVNYGFNSSIDVDKDGGVDDKTWISFYLEWHHRFREFMQYMHSNEQYVTDGAWATACKRLDEEHNLCWTRKVNKSTKVFELKNKWELLSSWRKLPNIVLRLGDPDFRELLKKNEKGRNTSRERKWELACVRGDGSVRELLQFLVRFVTETPKSTVMSHCKGGSSRGLAAAICATFAVLHPQNDWTTNKFQETRAGTPYFSNYTQVQRL